MALPRGWERATKTPLTKNQKEISTNLVLHIYNKQHPHLSMIIGQLIAGALLFGIQSCEYLETPKGEAKLTCILCKGDIRFYREHHELIHNSGRIQLVKKNSPTFRTQKNGSKNTTLTQWRRGKCLCLVHIWANIISRLDSYPWTWDDNPLNTAWLENHKTTITYQMTIKYMISGTLSLGEERLGLSHKEVGTLYLQSGFPWRSS